MAKAAEKLESFMIGDKIASNEVPVLAHQDNKWAVLIEQVCTLDLGEVLPVTFQDQKLLIKARASVRQAARLRSIKLHIQTDMQKMTVYFGLKQENLETR